MIRFLPILFLACFSLNYAPLNQAKKGTGFSELGTNISFNNVDINTREANNLFDYFFNLTQNLGDNPSVICVSVACGMIASYLDTFYNDNIINDIYDLPSQCENLDFSSYLTGSSPGIFSSISSVCMNEDGSINETLFNNYHDYIKDVVGVQTITQNGKRYFKETMYVSSTICSFFNSISDGYNSSFSFNIKMITADNENEIIESIDNGFPTLMCVSGGNLNHAVVAFAYDDDGNYYYHNGYKETNEFGLQSFGMTNSFIEAYVIELIDYTHLCSNNYYSINQDGSRTYYCPCMLNGMTYPNHNHNISHSHSYHFDENNNLIQNATHYETCLSCQALNENITNNGNYYYLDNKSYECRINDVVYMDNNTHTINFGCGNSLSESHHAIDFICVGTDIHLVHCLCGELYSEHHNWCIPVLINGQIENICICGLIPLDHDEEWRSFIREYLQTHDYFDEDFYEVLLSNI